MVLSTSLSEGYRILQLFIFCLLDFSIRIRARTVDSKYANSYSCYILSSSQSFKVICPLYGVFFFFSYFTKLIALYMLSHLSEKQQSCLQYFPGPHLGLSFITIMLLSRVKYIHLFHTTGSVLFSIQMLTYSSLF